MTADELANSDFIRSGKRLLALELLMQQGAFPDVVREAQEIVELVLKGMLRAIGIDPPKRHDVGPSSSITPPSSRLRFNLSWNRWRRPRDACAATARLRSMARSISSPSKFSIAQPPSRPWMTRVMRCSAYSTCGRRDVPDSVATPRSDPGVRYRVSHHGTRYLTPPFKW